VVRAVEVNAVVDAHKVLAGERPDPVQVLDSRKTRWLTEVGRCEKGGAHE